MPAKSAVLYSRASHSMRPSRAHPRTRDVAFGATRRTEAAVARRLSILASPTDPAPTTRTRRPSSFTNMGNKLIVVPGTTPDYGSRAFLATRFQIGQRLKPRRIQQSHGTAEAV